MTAQKLSGMFVAVLVVGALIPAAEASGLADSSFSWQYYAGGSACSPNTGGSMTGGTFIDDGGVDGTFAEPGPLEFFDIDAADTTITFDFSPYYAIDGSWSSSPLSLTPTIDNGIAIDLLSPGSFSSVAIDPATNMSGFLDSDLSFTGNEIQVNWAGLSFDTTTLVTLDVSLADPATTPEPGTWSLMALTLLVAGLIRRRRRIV